MATPGRKPKPHLTAVREGTFREDRHTEGARFAPTDPVEPDWAEILPGSAKVTKETRAKAAEVWGTVVPAVVAAAGLTNAQRETAIDYCVTAARIWQGERVLSREGMTVETERGMVKHPMTTILNSYRSHFRSLTGELGLSPSAAARIAPPNRDDEDSDIFD